jgi:pyridoxine 5-phosphate synthase
MAKLSVNVNKLATLRNARGKNNPNVLQVTLDLIKYGAQGITVHPRPDERHIRYQDVYEISTAIDVEFNIEGYPDEKFLDLVKKVKPTQCTLVPDAPNVLTSNAGWKITPNLNLLKTTVEQLHEYGIRTSLFVDPYTLTQQELDSLVLTKTDRVELYTEAYAENYKLPNAAQTLAVYQCCATQITQLGIDLNAGHDLSLDNLAYFLQQIPNVKEVSIGHALICDALYLGLEETIKRYLQAAQCIM